MKKLARVASLCLIAAVCTGVAVAADVAAPEKPVTVSNFGSKSAVTFDHALHARPGLECATCHHAAAEGKYRCGECHLLEADEKAPRIRDAVHGKEKGACYECHLQKDAEHKLKCSDCHKG